MKSLPIRLVSDLHTEFVSPYQMADHISYVLPPMPGDEDTVLVLAGDICKYEDRLSYQDIMAYVSRTFREVLILAGNHEYYGGNYPASQDKFLDHIKDMVNVHFLDGTSVMIGDSDPVAFIGATLWTDYHKNNPSAKLTAESFMNDYRFTRNGQGSRITPDTLLASHNRELAAITKLLEENAENRCVVVTHHGCSYQSIHPMYKNAGLVNYAFSSDLDALILKHQPEYWFHGHTHKSLDYRIGKTRVIVNPAGYRHFGVNSYENWDFDPTLKVYV